MKEYNIILLSNAKSDLFEIVEYLSSFYKSTAIKKYDKIIESISKLKDFPYLGSEYKSVVSDFDYRKLVVDEYMVFYVVIDTTIEIHNIINSKMDIGSLV